MSLRLAVHWALVVLVATLAAALPLPGRYAGAIGAAAAIGYAYAPAPTRKAPRP